MKSKKFNHPVALRIIYDLIDRIPIEQTGTYNRQDPTKFEKGVLIVKGLRIELHDCTWGVELTIYSDANARKGYELAGIYLSRGDRNEGDELIVGNLWHNKWLLILRQINKDCNPIEYNNHNDYEEDPMGPVSRYI